MMNTPKKAVKFANELQLQRPIPHLVFIVFESKSYKTSILKILLNFHFHVNPLFTFSIFTKTCAAKAYDFCAESLQALNTVVPVKGSLSDMIHLLDLAIHGVNWNQNSAVALQSPVKKDLAWSKNVKIRNYLFMVADLPENMMELQQLVETKSNNQIQLLQSLNEHFLTEKLWMALAKNRVSLCWVHQHIVDKNFALTEAWISCLFKQCGSLTLSDSLLEEREFPKIWEDYLQPTVIDLALVKLLCNKKSAQLKIFNEHIDKAFVPCDSFKHPKAWSGPISLCDSDISWPDQLLTELNCIIACKKLPGIEIDEYVDMKIIGVAGCDKLPKFSNEDGFCVPLLGEVVLGDFAYTMSFLYSRNLCILVEFMVKALPQTAAIRSIAPSLAGFYLIPADSEITVCQYDEASMKCKEIENHDISPWLQPEWPTSLSHFLQTGKILPKQTEFIQNLCLGVWRVADSAFVLTPKPKTRFAKY
jgi:hypothetical protein